MKQYPDLSQWILLGYGQQLLTIDREWKGLATSGCGEWRLLPLSKNDQGYSTSDISVMAPRDSTSEQESIWEYCARVGATELTGDQIPDHIASDFQEITFHPMKGRGGYIYQARCGYVEGSETATLLICQPHNWGGNAHTKWAPPTMGAGLPWTPCLAHPYQVGDSVTALFSPDVLAEICKGVHGPTGTVVGCKTAYEDHIETGEEAFLYHTNFRQHANTSWIDSFLTGSYISGEFLHLSLRLQEIDRDGYFSDLWFAVPEGCTGFETHEVGRGSYRGGYTESELFTFRGKCFQSQVGRTEVAWVIPEGRVKLPDSILEGTEN